MPDRDVVFISHANPEDNDFARWLTLKLAACGYHAWSDITKLLGGEDFWEDIERTIRKFTIRFLYVLSSTSNHKPGPLSELYVAERVARKHGFKDFVIPVRIDDIPYGDMNIELARLNAIDCSSGWAAGLRQLLTKLREDKTPTRPDLCPKAVSEWWQQEFDVNEGLSPAPERHFSNWFTITLPKEIFLHSLTRDTIGLLEPPATLSYPAVWHSLRLITFTPKLEIEPSLGQLHVTESECMETEGFLSDRDTDRQRENRNLVTELVADSWERYVSACGLRAYPMANGKHSFYFDRKALPKQDVHFMGVDGRETYRALMGYKTLKNGTKRHWHFAVSAKAAVHPEPMLMVRTHVLFSDDGLTIWTSADRMHRARRSQCKDWWNDVWRDRLLATMTWLAGSQTTLPLPLCSSAPGFVSIRPVEFVSPVTLNEPTRDAELAVDVTDDQEEEEEG